MLGPIILEYQNSEASNSTIATWAEIIISRASWIVKLPRFPIHKLEIAMSQTQGIRDIHEITMSSTLSDCEIAMFPKPWIRGLPCLRLRVAGNIHAITTSLILSDCETAMFPNLCYWFAMVEIRHGDIRDHEFFFLGLCIRCLLITWALTIHYSPKFFTMNFRLLFSNWLLTLFILISH